MRNNSYLFLLLLIAITLMTSGCKQIVNDNTHNHEFIDGVCSCGKILEVTYKVTFVDYDGTILKVDEVKENESAEAPFNPNRDGYDFTGWSTEFKNITSDLVVVAMYELINDVNISVSPAYDFIFEGNVLIEYIGFQNIVSIPSYYECGGQKIKVKEIGERAFYDILSLVEVHIPNTVEIIGKQSFKRCENLKNVIMGDNVIEIQSEAFSNCSSLQKINLSKNLKKLEGAFSSCINLTSITIPSSVESIDSDEFYGCVKLVEIYNLTNIDVSASTYDKSGNIIETFTKVVHKSLEEDSILFKDKSDLLFYNFNDKIYLLAYLGNEYVLNLPDDFDYDINEYAFYYSRSLQEVVINGNVKTIGLGAFESCVNLRKVVINEGTQVIGSHAFDWCPRLETITIPSTCIEIRSGAFYYCQSLTKIFIPNSVKKIGSDLFTHCEELTIYCEASSKPVDWDENWNSYNRPVEWGCNNNIV